MSIFDNSSLVKGGPSTTTAAATMTHTRLSPFPPPQHAQEKKHVVRPGSSLRYGKAHTTTHSLSEDPSLTTCFFPGRVGVGGMGKAVCVCVCVIVVVIVVVVVDGPPLTRLELSQYDILQQNPGNPLFLIFRTDFLAKNNPGGCAAD